MSAATENVKVDLVVADSAAGVPKHTKLAHILSILIAGVIALCVASALADGSSVIVLKHEKDLPTVTNPELKNLVTLPKGSHVNLKYNLAELLGPFYGVGLHHDQSGHIWNEAGSEYQDLKHLIDDLGIDAVIAAVPSVISTDGLKHPVHFLGCYTLEATGLTAMSFGFIAEMLAVAMIFFHSLALAGMLPAKPAKVFAVLVWAVLGVGFLIVCLLAMAAYTQYWACDQVIIPTIRLSDHFDYNYGFGFAIIGFISSILILCVQLAFTSTKDGEAAKDQGKVKSDLGMVLAGVVSGLAVFALLSVAVIAANDGFDDQTNPFPNGTNPCEGQKPYHAGPGDSYFSNTQCIVDSVAQTLEQAGANVTKGFVGLLDAKSRTPITKKYSDAGLCAVNVHWHLGAEHLSVGQYDTKGTGPLVAPPASASGFTFYDNEWLGSAGSPGASPEDGSGEVRTDPTRPRASDKTAPVRSGFQCHHYETMTTPQRVEYNWKHCTHMHVGETYEVHWPHSAAGACGTEWQMQSPFYDGVFCRDGIITIAPLNTFEKIGVQAQVFTIVNDDDPALVNMNLIQGMIVNADKNQGTDMGIYTGSTTGTSRDNEVCSRYTPITWQVDRQCHKISASSFDKMCKDMLEQKDDMHGDIHPHGARELVAPELSANNMKNRK